MPSPLIYGPNDSPFPVFHRTQWELLRTSFLGIYYTVTEMRCLHMDQEAFPSPVPPEPLAAPSKAAPEGSRSLQNSMLCGMI